MNDLCIRYRQCNRSVHGKIYLDKNTKHIVHRSDIQNFKDISTFSKYFSIGNAYIKKIGKSEYEYILGLEPFLFSHVLLLSLEDTGLDWCAMSTDKYGPFRGILPGRNSFVGYLLSIEELIEQYHIRLTHDTVIFLDDDWIKAMYIRYEGQKDKKMKKLLIKWG